MQSPKKERNQKQLPSSGSKPQVLNPKVLSPHEIEREVLLKKIESLRYSVKQLERENAEQRVMIKIQDATIEVTRMRANLLEDSLLATTKAYSRMAEQIKCLTRGEEWKPEVQKIVEANKIPVNYN